MSMGTYANSALVIDNDYVKRMATQQFIDFKREWSKALSVLSPNEAVNFEGTSPEFNTTWANLQEKFAAKTDGIELRMLYHSAEERGDDINGLVFTVDHSDMYELTPAGKAINKYVEIQYYTTWG